MIIISKEAKQKLKSMLPGSISNGYDLIQVKLPELSRQQIEKAFNSDSYYREDVMLAAIEVIEEAKAKAQKLEEKISAL